MTHDELVNAVENYAIGLSNGMVNAQMAFNIGKAMQSLVKLHFPDYYDFPDDETYCGICKDEIFPCKTIQAIVKQLNG